MQNERLGIFNKIPLSLFRARSWLHTLRLRFAFCGDLNQAKAAFILLKRFSELQHKIEAEEKYHILQSSSWILRS